MSKVKFTELAADPDAPVATKRILYAKSGGLYQRNSAGTVAALSTSGEVATAVSNHSAESWAHIPVGTVMEFASNPDADKWAPLDGRWVTRASCPQLSVLWPHPQPETPAVVAANPGTTSSFTYLPDVDLFFTVTTGTTSTMYYSADGENWTTVTMPSSSTWRQIAYVDGLYLALGATNVYATSPDLVNWTTRTFPATLTSPVLAGANGKFVVCGNASALAYYSTNGIDWLTSAIQSTNWSWVRYINGRFIALSSANITTPVSYSSDGITWVTCPVVVSTIYALVYWDGTHYWLHSSSASAYKTTDFVSWTGVVLTSQAFRAVDVVGGRYFSLSTASKGVSEDGLNYVTDRLPYTDTTPTNAASDGSGMMLILAGTNYIRTQYNGVNLYLPKRVGTMGNNKFVRVDGPVIYA